MKTQIEQARAGKISGIMRTVARHENVEVEHIRAGIAGGTIVIPANRCHNIKIPCAIGSGLRTKVNANIGTSKDSSSISKEIDKLRVATQLGSDTIMDLSTGPRLKETRSAILGKSKIPVGTVPIYQVAVDTLSSGKEIRDMSAGDMFSVLEEQAAEGVDFFTIHAGVTRKVIDALNRSPRHLNIVSRGGAMLANWIVENDQENPFYEDFDSVIDIARRYDITLSLGDGLRPGSLLDATDSSQIEELLVLGELQKRAIKKGVQVMVEGPGHVPLDQIEANVKMQKSICNNAPFYVLGPLVTDVAPGYDHITAAIGGALAASKGADFLCYVTPAEHLRLPTIDDVKDGVIASRIAAHAADIAKGVKNAIDWDRSITKARLNRDWKTQFALAIDSAKPNKYRKMSSPNKKDVCTMCSEYCSIMIAEKCVTKNKERALK